ncbi:hypothetical protein DSO57_1021255 [Entomophthora muscae]|uniref:Uncharacterized protein n=1 Tax=Entomophthora muscae TaxID=34485 RepID=A0ACC2RI17_9FUNG|nr:hypothetical protein DSO57_1021255 [Entomophthora muscae]
MYEYRPRCLVLKPFHNTNTSSGYLTCIAYAGYKDLTPTKSNRKMQFSLTQICILFTVALSLPLERRKDFYTTHEEHGHLPGLRNPSPMQMLDQVKRIATGENPFKVLNDFNEKADETKGARFGRETAKTGRTRYLDALGFSDIPIIGKY